MKDIVLLELANRWDLDAADPNEEGNNVKRGAQEAKRECADTLRTLVGLLGDSGEAQGPRFDTKHGNFRLPLHFKNSADGCA